MNTNIQVIEIKIEDYNWETTKIKTDFCDVTLACDNKQIKAHKSILQDLSVQLKNYHHHHQDSFHVQVRDEYRNDNFGKKIDNSLLEETSILWTQVRVEFKIWRKNPVIRHQNKIFQTF